MQNNSIHEMNAAVENEAVFIKALVSELRKVIVGQDTLVERVIIGLLTDGHILIEGVPGLAKTTLVKSLAETVQAGFSRIQFTPDLLPADLVGTQIYNPSSSGFSVHKGPIFSNLILADEVNRAPAKVQSALLEAMQERQVTIGDTTFALEELFVVLATQNPIEQEGTYPLPEAQVDRFMLKVVVEYPSRDEERLIINRVTSDSKIDLNPVVDVETILQARKIVQQIYVDDKVKEYVLDLISATRQPTAIGLPELEELISYGASPRAGIYLINAARANAFINGRGYVNPDDIKELSADVLRHRIIVSYEAESQEITSSEIIQKILDHIEVP
tara:strand:- start:12897 stop:13889 length:993 start_codon:yes stop_codon:yes gene_type:complete